MRLKGGKVLLDLSALDGQLPLVDDEITDAGVLAQLRELYPLVKGGLKNLIYIKTGGVIIPCEYMISGLEIIVAGSFTFQGKINEINLDITYDVGDYDEVSIDGAYFKVEEIYDSANVGGTKLYKHTAESIYSGYDMFYIDTNNTPKTSLSDFLGDAKNSIVCRYGNNLVISCSSGPGIYYFNSSGVWTNVAQSSMSFSTDIVTEL